MFWFARQRRPSVRSRRPFARLGLEVLERRWLLALYSFEHLQVNGGEEYRFKKNDFHFESLLRTPFGEVARRAATDLTDPNRFGTTVYDGAYVNTGSPRGQIASVTASDTGITYVASGPVMTPAGPFGTWTTSRTVSYDEATQRLTATGSLDVALDGPLSQAGGDLTVRLINSNRLVGVPLQFFAGAGLTGDLRRAAVDYGPGLEDKDLVYRPETQSATFPQDRTTSLTVSAVGEVNVVDTQRQGLGFQIAAARKPGVDETLTTDAAILAFGGTFDVARQQDFSADNVGLVFLVHQQATAATQLHFALASAATAGPPLARADSYRVVKDTTLTVGGAGVLGNDAAAFAARARAVLVTPPQHGVLQLHDDGTFTYVPASGYVGSDAFDYSVNDGRENGNVATVALTVSPPIPARIVVGTDAGPESRVRILDAATRVPLREIAPFSGFSGGVSVATGDVNGDGVFDVVVGAGSGGRAHVKVFDGATGGLLTSFFSFDNFDGPVSVAAGDVTGDGKADVAIGAPIDGHVRVFDLATGQIIRSFLAFENFAGSVSVAVGDLNGDRRDDLIIGASAQGHVKAFDAVSNALVQSFLAYVNFNSSVSVAAGDVNGDGFAEIITGAGSAAAHVKIFDGRSNAAEASFIAFAGPIGVRVGATDADADGKADVLSAPASSVAHLRVFNGPTMQEIASDLVFSGTFGVSLGGSH